MIDAPGWPAHLLLAVVVLWKVAEAVSGFRSRELMFHRLTTEPMYRSQLYRLLIVNGWIGVLVVALFVAVSPEVTAAGIGWSWPAGAGLDYLATAALLVLMPLGGLRVRLAMRRGRPVPAARVRMAPLLPVTTRERWLAVALSVTAGIAEEAVYRGLLIAAGTQLYGLPLPLAALLSLALFVAGHLYQGRRALLGITYLGVMFTGVYLMSGSLLLVVVLHICQDLVALLLVPAGSTPRPTSPDHDLAATSSTTRTAGSDTVTPLSAAGSDAVTPLSAAGTSAVTPPSGVGIINPTGGVSGEPALPVEPPPEAGLPAPRPAVIRAPFPG